MLYRPTSEIPRGEIEEGRPRRRNSDRRGALGAAGQIFRPQGGWVSGRVIERRGIQAGHPCCCDDDVALVGERRPIPPLTKHQSLLQHRAGSSRSHPAPSYFWVGKCQRNRGHPQASRDSDVRQTSHVLYHASDRGGSPHTNRAPPSPLPTTHGWLSAGSRARNRMAAAISAAGGRLAERFRSGC